MRHPALRMESQPDFRAIGSRDRYLGAGIMACLGLVIGLPSEERACHLSTRNRPLQLCRWTYDYPVYLRWRITLPEGATEGEPLRKSSPRQ